MAFKTDYNRVQGLGAAGDGAHHWWSQRLTSVALIPLAVLFIVPFGRALGGGHDALIATYGTFGHALIAVLFIAVAFLHLAQGLQVVIEDYVPAKAPRVTLLILNILFCGTMGVAGVLAVATILFRA
jgi:succinate dehydrogenase / fumarate reductase membrane anchor subunit